MNKLLHTAMALASQGMRVRANNDNGQNARFYDTQMQLVVKKAYERKYPRLAYSSIFTVENQRNGQLIDSIEFQMNDAVGMASIIADFSDDLPAVSTTVSKQRIGVEYIGNKFSYGYFEVQKARAVGTDLRGLSVTASFRAHQEKHNAIAFGVDEEATDAGLPGLLNNPNIPVGNMLAGAWATATAEKITFDMNDALHTVDVNSGGHYRPNKILMAPQLRSYLEGLRFTNGESLLINFVKNSTYIASVDDIVSVPELAGAGPTGRDLMVAYDTGEGGENFVYHNPYITDVLDTLQDGLSYKTPVVGSVAGLEVRAPLAIVMREEQPDTP